MMPYINWAKSYRYQNITDGGKESWRAGWLMNLYEATVTLLSSVLASQTRLNDPEKAQLFLGYIAALPKKDKPAEQTLDDTGSTDVDKNETK